MTSLICQHSGLPHVFCALSARCILLAAGLISLTSAHGQTVFTKADNATSLDVSTAWSPAALPTAADTLLWTGTYASGSASSSLGAGRSVNLLQVTAPSRAMTIAAGTGPLTLSAASGTGVDMSAATQNFTVNAPVVLGSSQAWTINSGRTLTVGGAISDEGSARALTVSGFGTATFSGANTFSGGLIITPPAGGLPVYKYGGNNPSALVTLSGGALPAPITANGRLNITAPLSALGPLNGSGSLGFIANSSTTANTLTFTGGSSFSMFNIGADNARATLRQSGSGGVTFAFFGYNTATPNAQHIFDGGLWTLGQIGQNNSGAQTSGTYTLTNGAEVTVSAQGTFAHGTWRIINGALRFNSAIAVQHGSATGTHTSLVFQVDNSGGGPGLLTATGGLTLADGGSMTNANSLTIGDGGTVSLAGGLTLGSTTARTAETDTVTLSTGGELLINGTLSAAATTTGQTRVFNWTGGQLTAATITPSAGFTAPAPAPATGGITTTALHQTAGVLAPGDVGGTGRTTINGGYTLGAGGTLALDLGGPAAATAFQTSSGSYDQLVVNNGPVSLAGALTVSLVNGFVPTATQSFTLLNNTGTGAGITGAFANIASGQRLITTDGKGSFLLTFTATSVALSDFLWIAPEPIITTQPLPLAAATGKTGVFSVSVTGRGPFTYQWRKDGVNIPGANTATLFLPNLQASSVASYDVVINNAAGIVTSAAAPLTVESAVPGVLRFEMDQTPVATADGITNAGGTGNGTLVGSPLPSVISGARAFTGSAWDFSAKTSWLRVPSTTPILRTLGNRQLSNGITFSFWMNLGYTVNSGMDAARLFSFSNGVETYAAYVNGTFLTYDLPAGRNGYTWGTLNGTWQHLVLVYDFEKATGNFLFYGKDAASTGNQVLRGTQTFAPPAVRAVNPGDFVLGAMGPQGYLWPGKVDQFQVFNRALTVTEINQLYTTGTISHRSPSVSVGASRDTLTWPANSVTVTAYATDDALPTASRNLTRTWSKVSGPGTASFAASTPTADPSTLSDSTTVTFTAAGTYVLRCTVSDGSLSQSGEVTVQALVNTAPVVTAQADRTIVSAAAPTRINLTGYTRDDGLPNPPGLVIATWSQVSGPATVTFDRTDLLSTSVTLPAVGGNYVLRLSGTDGSLTTNADLTLTVTDNFAPTVAIQASAQTLSWPATTATLTGVVTDDGVPGQPSGQWTQLSGPGTVVFGSSAALHTSATFPALGQYVLRFTGSDGQKSASTDAYFTVWSPGAPFVNPGSSRAAWLPGATIPLSGSFSGNTTPTPGVAWSVLQTPAGVLPGTVSFSAPAALQTEVTFTTPGTYILGLTVTDGPVANTGRLVVQVYDSTVTTATFRNRTVPSGNFGYTRSQLNAFTGDLGLQFDLGGVDWNVIKPPPPVGVHPRLLVNAEDLPVLRARHGIGQTATTAAGPVLLQTMRARCAAELTAPGATWHAAFNQLINGDATLYAAMDGEDMNNFFGILAYEAWRCLLENDLVAGPRVAAAISTACGYDLARMQASPSGYWAGMEGVASGSAFHDNFTNAVHLHFTAYAYDYAHTFMTEAQRSVARQTLSFATTNQFSVGLDAVPNWAANCSNWIFNSSLYLLASVLAIEGEEGYPADVLPRLAATYDRLFSIGFGPDGAMWEGMGKGQLNAEALVMLGKRGYLTPLSTAARYCIQRQYLHSLETTGYAFTWDEYNPGNGGKNNFAAARYADVPVLKALYPQDPLIDFVLRNEYGRPDYLASSRLTTIAGNFIYSRADQLIRSALLRDFRTDLTWQQAVDQQVAPTAPLSQLFNSRGLVTARSTWQPDGLRLMFLPRANNGGHAIADRGSIGLSALGRVWIPVTGVNPLAGDTSLAASVPRIDDVGPTTVPVKMVEFRDTPDFFLAAADAKDAYAYDLASSSQSGAIPNFITPNSRLLTPRPVGWADVPLSLSNDWLYSTYPASDGHYLVTNTPVQRAYRTLGLVRGPRPYVVIADDLQKDTASHTYVSRLMLEADLTSLTVSGNDAIVTKSGSTTSLLVRVVNGNGTPAFTQAAPFSLNALDITVTAVAPDFRVLLFPYTHGEALPVTTYQNNVLSVTLDGRTDRIHFAPHADGRARLTFTRPSDLTPPVLSGVPGNQTFTPNTANPTYTFAVTATDNVDGPVPVTFTRSDGVVFTAETGAAFAAGTTTTVTATATDSSLNTASATFTVTVLPYTPTSPGAPWTVQNVGTQPVTPGTATHDAIARIFTINGTGGTSGANGDIWTGTSEGFTYVSRPWTGDGVFTARLTSFTSTDSGAKAGLMLRETLTAGAKNSIIYLTRAGAATFQNKTAVNGATTNTNFFSNATAGRSLPEWLRLIRAGQTLTGYYSDDGVTWIQQGTSVTHTMTGTDLTVGLSVAPRTGGSTANVVFDNVTFLAFPTAPASPTATGGFDRINLTWGSVADAVTYTVRRASISGGPYVVIASGLTGTSFTDTTATPGVPSYYVITAVNPLGESPASTEVTATALAGLATWRQTYFGTTTNTGNAADLSDSDRDGVPNLIEYALGTVPTARSSAAWPTAGLSPTSPTDPAPRLTLTFLRARADVTYTVEATSSLAAPIVWTPLATNPGTVSPTAPVTVTDTVSLPTATSRRYLRLRVSVP